jgi:hypothetical protein
VSYRVIDALTQDAIFGGRNRAACVEQAQTFHADARPAWVAVADACLRGDGTIYNAFTRLAAGGPGIGDKGTGPDGEPDQTLILDADILALTQANWPTIAVLYFEEDGTPVPQPLEGEA